MNPTTTRGIAPVDAKALPTYAPTTYVDFSRPENQAAFEKALAEVRASFGQEAPLVIGGQRMKGSGTFDSTNPAKPSEVLGRFQSGTKEQAIQAIETAQKVFADWSRVPAAERAAYLIEAARRMRERRHWYSAWMVLEVGKSWPEADADTAEAIDFLEFYAREMLRYDRPEPIIQLAGERDNIVYLPLGVGAIIPPWNFPLAICVGMASAAIVTGNTVVLKPASDTPGIAWQFVALLEEVGLPPGVHAGQDEVGQDHRRGQHRVDRAPVAGRAVPARVAGIQLAGTVDQDVDLGRVEPCRGSQVGDGVEVGQVADDRDEPGQCIGHHLEPVLVHVDPDHVHSVIGEQGSDGPAGAGCRTGDNGGRPGRAGLAGDLGVLHGGRSFVVVRVPYLTTGGQPRPNHGGNG